MAKKKTLRIGEIDYERIVDWSGGVNDAVNPALLGENESALLENASLDEKGTLFPRKGSRDRYSPRIDNLPVSGMGAYYKSDGTSRLLIGADTNLYTDNPHVMEIFNLQGDFATGEVEGMASVTKKPGSVVNDGDPENVVQATDTEAEWNAGEKSNISVSPAGTITIEETGGVTVEHVDEDQADWDAGVHNDTFATAEGTVRLLQEGADVPDILDTEAEWNTGDHDNTKATAAGDLVIDYPSPPWSHWTDLIWSEL